MVSYLMCPQSDFKYLKRVPSVVVTTVVFNLDSFKFALSVYSRSIGNPESDSGGVSLG